MPDGPLVTARLAAGHLGDPAGAGPRRPRPPSELAAAARQADRVRGRTHPGRGVRGLGARLHRCRRPGAGPGRRRGGVRRARRARWGSATATSSSPTTTTTASSPPGSRGRFATTAPRRGCSTAAGRPGGTRADPVSDGAVERARRGSRRARGRGCAARWPRSRKRGPRGATLVDARPRHLFLGEHGRGEHGPHPRLALPPVPGAGRRRDRTVGRAGRGRAGSRAMPGSTPTRPPRELIATCGSGVSATVALLALERIGIHCDGRLRRLVQRVERATGSAPRLRRCGLSPGRPRYPAARRAASASASVPISGSKRAIRAGPAAAPAAPAGRPPRPAPR